MDKTQLKLLKDISRKPGYYDASLPLSYLTELNYIRICQEHNCYGEPIGPYICDITELGKDVLYLDHQSKFRMWIPYTITTIISITALVFSSIALFS